MQAQTLEDQQNGPEQLVLFADWLAGETVNPVCESGIDEAEDTVVERLLADLRRYGSVSFQRIGRTVTWRAGSPAGAPFRR